MAEGIERRAVVIVGSGPAGSATALALAMRDRALVPEILVLEKGAHPREKTCAGGVIPKAFRLLRSLDVDVSHVPQVRVDRASVVTPYGDVAVAGDDVCRVVRRAEFDAALAATVRARGVEVRERAHVRDVVRDGERVRVETDVGVVSAAVVVGADGSGSLVRRRLVGGPTRIARAVMRDVEDLRRWDGHAARRYEFDFRDVAEGLRGYAWAFPTLIADVPHVNVGSYALAPATAGSLTRAMDRTAERIGVVPETAPRKAFPIRVWVPGTRVAARRTLLVGDAGGADALLGEGISFALEYGMLAAEAIVHARCTGAWDFAHYQRAVDDGVLGRKLGRLATAARHFYGPRWPLWFRAAHWSARAQRLGLAWYNGEPDVEDAGRWGLAARLLRPGTRAVA